MSLALHFQPDPERHIARLPESIDIDGKPAIKAYATNYAAVYLQYETSLFLVYKIDRVGPSEEFGLFLGTQSELTSAIDIAAKENNIP